MPSDIRIQTARFVLRPLTLSDGAEIVELINDYEVARWLTVVPHPYALSDFHAFLDYLKDGAPLGGLGIEEDGALLGVVGFDTTLGYWLGQAHQGRGVMTEAAGALVDHVFRDSDVQQIKSGYFRGNAASSAVLRKLGFRETGTSEHVNCVSQAHEVEMINVILTRENRAARQ